MKLARRIKLAFGISIATAAWCAQPGTWRTAAWVTLIAMLAWCASPAQAATVYTCAVEVEVPFQNDAGAICGGSYAVLDESAVTASHAVLSCRGGSTVDGDPWSVCQNNGGYYGFIFPSSLLATDLVERDNTGTFGSATSFSFYVPDDPEPSGGSVLVAYCLDDPPPVGQPLSACTNVVWEEPLSAIPELTIEGALQILAAAGILWALAFGFRVIYNSMEN
jgi:hypothetical protein